MFSHKLEDNIVKIHTAESNARLSPIPDKYDSATWFLSMMPKTYTEEGILFCYILEKLNIHT